MNIRKRLLSFIICGVMAFSASPLTAFADDSVYTGGLCEHHREHNEECGYVPAKERNPCGYWCEICAGETEESDKADATDETDEIEEPECECDTLCTEDEVNEDCPVCSAEGAEMDKVCVGAAPMLPVTALAAEGAPTALYVGNQVLKNNISYWKTDPATGELTEYTEGGDAWNVQYNPETVTLTLKNATVVGKSYGDNNGGIGIYATSSSGSLSLNIVLDGNSKVSGWYGINVSSGGAASLSISGSGSLTVSATATNGIGIFVQAQYDANLTINGANVNAVVTETNGRGVELSTGQVGNPNLTIEVKGGSLQASGQPNGIKFFTNKNNTQANANLKVSGNAMVKASSITTDADGSGSQSPNLTTGSSTGDTGGIVFDGKNGTVYGDVTLQEDLNIGEGENLTIGKDASLTVPEGTTLTNNGTVTTTGSGSLTNSGTINNSGTLPDNIQGSAPPKITTTDLPDGEVGEGYSQPLAADGNNITWSSSNLPDWLGLENNTISGTPTAAGSSTFTITATNGNGSDSKEFTLSINEETKYSLTVNLNGGNGTTTGGQYTKGTEIRIDAGTKSGYRFAGWTSSNGGSFADPSNASTTFTMPANDTSITANWKKKSSGGSYSLSEGTDRDEPKDEPEEEPEVEPDTPGTTGFIDVSIFDWYYDGVMYATENGIMNGVGGNRFEPETELKREMLAVILWNMTDNPEPNGIAPFLDVTSDKYYAKAIAWANENGVMYGYGEEFGVGEAVTREDFAAILYRYAAFKGYDTTYGGMAIWEFIDFEQIADYAVEALGWAVNSGIISGMGDGTISPKTSTYRGQAAVMLMKFCENIMK